MKNTYSPPGHVLVALTTSRMGGHFSTDDPFYPLSAIEIEQAQFHSPRVELASIVSWHSFETMDDASVGHSLNTDMITDSPAPVQITSAPHNRSHSPGHKSSPKRYTFISPEGQKVRASSVEFAERYGFNPSGVRALVCGWDLTMHGWMSTHPRAKKKRLRHQTVLLNTRTGKREILGPTAKAFAKRHRICYNLLLKLLRGEKIAHKGWILSKTYDLTAVPFIPDDNF